MGRAKKAEQSKVEGALILFGVRVRALRLAEGLSQEEFADKCELDRTYIGGIERGERNPSLRNIIKIAHALKVAPSVLFLEWSKPAGGSAP
jgi:transcriptional regulator with XRE-family HTH domain